MSTATANNIGHITQIIGSTFDVEFAEDRLPAIYNAVKIVSDFLLARSYTVILLR